MLHFGGRDSLFSVCAGVTIGVTFKLDHYTLEFFLLLR